MRGGPGKDGLTGGAGNDRIDARDGRPETVSCDSGNDRVDADRTDTLITCEHR